MDTVPSNQNQGVPENPLQRIKARGLFLWMLLGFVLMIVVGVIAESSLGDTAAIIVNDLLLFGLYLWPLIWLLGQLNKQSISFRSFATKQPITPKWGFWSLVGVFLVLNSIGFFYVLWYPISIYSPETTEQVLIALMEESANTEIYGLYLSMFYEFILIVILAPIIEEIFFRGILLQRWAAKWGLHKSIWATSILFGILHFDVLGGILFGIVMALLYLKTKSLLVPIFVHAVNNLIAFALIAYDQLQPSETTDVLAEFQSPLWFSLACFVISLPFLILYLKNNWPKKGDSLPNPLETLERVPLPSPA